MTTAEALRAHRLVTARMRVIRYEGSPDWTVVPVRSGVSQRIAFDKLGITFDKLIDAMTRAQEAVK